MIKQNYIALLMLFLAGTMVSCKKDNPPQQPAGNTSKSITSAMGGIRKWHGSHYYYASGPHFPTTINESYSYPDTSLAVIILGDSSVSFKGSNCDYSSTDTIKKIHYFNAIGDVFNYGMGIGIAYYYAKDSIVYCEGDYHNTTDFWEQKDTWYTY